MSLLAEPRRKQRISIDPQNVSWKNSETVGKKLMTSKMNWSEGKGLGKNEQGSADNLKLKPNYTGKGLGADKDARSKEQWISHHDDFASILANLNKSGKSSDSSNTADNTSIQSRSRSLKSRMHYKFTRGKDLSLATQQHKAAIFGGVNQKETVEEVVEETVEEEIKQEIQVPSSEDLNNQQVTISTISATDYYKEKMAKWLNKKKASTNDEELEQPIEQEVEATEEKRTKKSKSKSRKRKFLDAE